MQLGIPVESDPVGKQQELGEELYARSPFILTASTPRVAVDLVERRRVTHRKKIILMGHTKGHKGVTTTVILGL